MGAEFDQNAVPCDICDQWTADICKECGNCDECCQENNMCENESALEQVEQELIKQLTEKEEQALWDM